MRLHGDRAVKAATQRLIIAVKLGDSNLVATVATSKADDSGKRLPSLHRRLFAGAGVVNPLYKDYTAAVIVPSARLKTTETLYAHENSQPVLSYTRYLFQVGSNSTPSPPETTAVSWLRSCAAR